MKQRLAHYDFKKLIDVFNDEIFIWMSKNQMTLHDAFKYCRRNNEKYYTVLAALWGATAGKAYIKSKMKQCGNRPSLKQLNAGKYDKHKETNRREIDA